MRDLLTRAAAGVFIGVAHTLFLYIYEQHIIVNQAFFETYHLPSSGGILPVGFAILPLLWLPVRIARPSDIAIWIIYLLSYLPTCFIAFNVNFGPPYSGTKLVVIVLLGLVIIDLARRHRITLANNSMLGDWPLDLIFLLLSVAMCLYLLFLVRGSFEFDLETIYDRRLDARDTLAVLTGYLLAFVKSVVVVIGVYLAVAKRQWHYLPLVFLAMLSGFTIDGSKAFMIVPVILIGCTVFLLLSRRVFWLATMPAALISIAILEITLGSTDYVADYFVRRIFAIPGLLNAAYYDYFLVNDKVMMTDSIGRLFFTPTYDTSPAYIIGTEYLGDDAANANTGLWLGAYSHFALAGVVIFSLIAGLLLGLIDNLSRARFFTLGSLVAAYFGMTWVEQTLQTSMLSGGLFYLLIALAFITSSSRLQRLWAEPARSGAGLARNVEQVSVGARGT